MITDDQLYGHISKPQKLSLSNNLLGEKKKKEGFLGSWRSQQQLSASPVCGKTKQRGLVQIITLAALKLEPPDH